MQWNREATSSLKTSESKLTIIKLKSLTVPNQNQTKQKSTLPHPPLKKKKTQEPPPTTPPPPSAKQRRSPGAKMSRATRRSTFDRLARAMGITRRSKYLQVDQPAGEAKATVNQGASGVLVQRLFQKGCWEAFCDLFWEVFWASCGKSARSLMVFAVFGSCPCCWLYKCAFVGLFEKFLSEQKTCCDMAMSLNRPFKSPFRSNKNTLRHYVSSSKVVSTQKPSPPKKHHCF